MTEPTNEEPVQDEAVNDEDVLDDEEYDTYDDEDEHEIPINERKLLWSIVIVLAIFSVIEGLTIVSWGSRIRRLEQGAGPVGGAVVGGGGGGAVAGGGGAAFQPGAGPDGIDIGTGQTMVAGRAAVMQRIEEFVTANELEPAVAESLRVLFEDSERKLEELPSKEAAGEIAADERVTILREELERRDEEAETLLGEELAGKLKEALMSGPVGNPPPGPGAGGAAPPRARGGGPPPGARGGAGPRTGRPGRTGPARGR